MDKKFENYLIDLGTHITEYSDEAITKYKKHKNTSESGFKLGYMMALLNIVTLMQQQARVFDIDLKKINLDKISEKDFLSQDDELRP